MICWFTFPDLIKHLVFGLHLPVMGFDKSSNENGGKEILTQENKYFQLQERQNLLDMIH